MKIASKGQVTMPQAVREQAGLHPHSEVDFEVLANGDVVLRPVAAPAFVRPLSGCAAVPTPASSRAWAPTSSWPFYASESSC
jgi:AbrB family looped-hinge helix DNA binding protein